MRDLVYISIERTEWHEVGCDGNTKASICHECVIRNW